MKEVSKKLKCIAMRSGMQLWKEESRISNLIENLTGDKKVGFIKVDDEMINSVDIVGIFSPATMEEMTRRKNGQWQCSYSKWHKKGEDCECHKNKIQIENDRRLKEMAEAGNISEEQRITNSNKFRGMKNKIFNN